MPDEVIAAPAAEQTQADPSPATNHQEVLNNLSSDQRAKWRMTGELPSKEGSAPSKENSETEKVETAPASEAGHQEKPKRDNAESRLKELLADLKNAGFTPAELKTFKREAAAAQPKAESTPAPKIEVKAEATADPEAPKEPDIKAKEFQGEDGWEKYEAAVRKYNREFAEFASKKAVLEFQDSQRRGQELQRVQAQITEGRAKYQDFDEKAMPVIEALSADPKSPLYEMVGRSPVFQHLVYVIGGEREEFLALAKSDPWAAVSKAAVMQALIMEELKGGGKSEGDKPRNADGTFVKTESPVKKVSGAPPPPKEVGGTAAAPGDKVEESVKKRDFASYKAEMNRKEMAAKRS